MTDGISVTPGTGRNIHADVITLNGVTGLAQVVKIVDATDASTTRMVVNSGGSINVAKSGTWSTTVTQSTASSLNVAAVGSIAHDAAATGNPLRIGVRARGVLSAYTSVATNDVTEVHADLDGVLLTRSMPLAVNLTTRVVATSIASAGFTQLAAVTLLRNYITAISIYNFGATGVNVSFLNGTTGSAVFWAMGCGVKVSNALNFYPPLRQPSTNTAFGYKLSSAIGGSGVVISVTGYQSKL